jgi:hypothetical protein
MSRRKLTVRRTPSRINQYDFDEMIDAMRCELKLSFWQGVSLSLAILVLSLCITLLLK